MADTPEIRRPVAERAAALAVLAALGFILGLNLRDQPFMSSVPWALAGGVAAAPVVRGASRVARYTATRRQ
ncbi:hypothetical protein [Streptomyces sp. MNP-20]|uniref:hypothetical protein n=1 Tax=Streptomyces sp. MNP-20 TaxID=2721165 RepID=UPI00155649FE|nr:hypothetical protein [Streptomyces sp. MNP-20]